MSEKATLRPLRLGQIIPLLVAALLALVATFGVVAYLTISATRDRVQNLAQDDYVMLISALEMQLSISAMTAGHAEVPAVPESEAIARVLKRIAEFNHQLTRYRRAAEDNPKHSASAVKVAQLFKQFEQGSLAVLESRNDEAKLLSDTFRTFRAIDQRIDADLTGAVNARELERPAQLLLATQLAAIGARISGYLSEFQRTQSSSLPELLDLRVAAFKRTLVELEKLPLPAARRAALADIKTRFDAGVKNIRGLLELNVVMSAQRAENARLRKSLNDVLDESMQSLAVRSLDTAAVGVLDTLNQVTWFAGALTVLLLIILAGAVLYVRVNVVAPARKVRDALWAVQKTGDLSVRVEAAGAPEVREISEHINGVLQQLNATTVSKLELEASQARLEQEVAERRSAQDALHETNQKLSELAVLDELTGLPNRRGLSDGTTQCIARARRLKKCFAVLFVDLDHFKEVNDTKGHDVGDDMLQAVSKRLRHLVREEDMVARMGGDEFVILMSEIERREDAGVLAQKILNEAAYPVVVGLYDMFWQASIGISTYPADGEDAITLLRAADIALYRAKEEGRHRFHYYSEELTVQATRRVEVADDLRRALENGDLFLQYQPQRSITSGALTGVEALLRWKHPRQGTMQPEEFIPIAEATGLIVPIGEWVLRKACAQARAWAAAGYPLRMAVNLSVRELSAPNIVGTIKSNLIGLASDLLEVEITESLIMKNPEASINVLRQLRAAGVSVAMDDFGIGYSSLSRIKELPLTRLKIDKSFVNTISNGEDGAALARALIALAHGLRLAVTAEGVENPHQLAFLRAERCGEYQGFWGGRPMLAEDITRLLESSAAPRGGSAPALAVVPRF